MRIGRDTIMNHRIFLLVGLSLLLAACDGTNQPQAASRSRLHFSQLVFHSGENNRSYISTIRADGDSPGNLAQFSRNVTVVLLGLTLILTLTSCVGYLQRAYQLIRSNGRDKNS